jgi:MFS transporter, AAHS family, 4-hydroxybenzoate transporter
VDRNAIQSVRVHGSRVQPSDVVDVEHAMNEVQLRGRVLLAVVLCSFTLVIDGFDNVAFGFTAPEVARHFGLSGVQVGHYLSLQQTGIAVGGVLGGWMGDRWGRRSLIVSCIGLFSLGNLATAWASNVLVFAGFRILCGFGLGAVMPSVVVYLMEILPVGRRAQLTTMASAALAVGGTLCGLLAPMLGAEQWSSLFLIGGLMPIALMPLIAWNIPESARFLARAGRSSAQVAKSLNRLMGSTRFHGRQTFTCSTEVSADTQWSVLLAEPLRGDTLCLWVMIFTLQFVVVAVVSMGTTLLTAAGLTLQEALTAMTYFTLGGIFGIVTIAWVIRRSGSRSGLSIFVLLAVLSLCLMVAIAAGVQVSAYLLRLVIGVTGFATMGVAMASSTLAAQVYPTAVRSTGTGTALTVGRIGAIASATVVAEALRTYSSAGVFAGLVMLLCLTVTAVWILKRDIPAAAA